MNKTTAYKFVLAVLAVIALGLVVLLVIRSINQTLDPLERANSQLGTQVSDLLHPTPTILPDPITIVDEVQALARLETIRYTVEKVITAETNQGALTGLFGDRLLFVAHGFVVAGIDMNKIQASDLQLDEGVLKVQLPATEILVATIDNEKSYVYDRQTGLFTRGDTSLETQARQVAEQEILKSAMEDGILDQASVNAKTYLKWFFESLGYQQVEFTTSSP